MAVVLVHSAGCLIPHVWRCHIGILSILLPPPPSPHHIRWPKSTISSLGSSNMLSRHRQSGGATTWKLYLYLYKQNKKRRKTTNRGGRNHCRHITIFLSLSIRKIYSVGAMGDETKHLGDETKDLGGASSQNRPLCHCSRYPGV